MSDTIYDNDRLGVTRFAGPAGVRHFNISDSYRYIELDEARALTLVSVLSGELAVRGLRDPELPPIIGAPTVPPPSKEPIYALWFLMRARVKDMPKALQYARAPMGPWDVQSYDPNDTRRPLLHRNETWWSQVWVNNRYSVQVSTVSISLLGEVTHLWIRRHDTEPVRSWADLLQIKNEIIGADRTAVEVFPPEHEVVDEANMLHLWAFPQDFVMPFCLHD